MVTAISWKDEYSVNIQEIDEQHKMLIQMIDDLFVAISRNKEEPQEECEVRKILERLLDYTRIHFAVEESLMRIFDYPDYEAHKTKHDRFIDEVLVFERRLKSNNRSKSSEQLVAMEMLFKLKEWLVNHILVIDKAYSRHMLNRGAARSWIRKFW